MRVLDAVVLVSSAFLSAPASPAQAELIVADADNFANVAPSGKEVDAIHGDFVVRNAHIVAVIARPVAGRHANMTTRDVGGGVIDLTQRAAQSDQLSAFYPGGRDFLFVEPEPIRVAAEAASAAADSPPSGESVTIAFRSEPRDDGIRQTIRYTLHADWNFLLVESTFANTGERSVRLRLVDEVRADRTFEYGHDVPSEAHWLNDEWFRQSYGYMPVDHEIDTREKPGNRPYRIRYAKGGDDSIELAPRAEHTLARRLLVGANQLQLIGKARALAGAGTRRVALRIADAAGPVDSALVKLFDGDREYASGRTSGEPVFAFDAPEIAFRVEVAALGRPTASIRLDAGGDVDERIDLELPAIVVGRVTDTFGRNSPCKVAFRGLDGLDSPHFGPDSGPCQKRDGVHNLVYSHDGSFRTELDPGRYEVIITRGPEHDMVVRQIAPERGEITLVTAALERTVDTRGWVSADFHSHSSPSGDNTSSQRGRVLNLLCEHVEFAPCTEHNRLSSYAPHIREMGVGHQIATCVGLELTSSPGDVNHHNVFPLERVPGVQDDGAPLHDADPLTQIIRVAMWDDRSEKLVQQNHPSIVKILGDRDLDGTADGGYRRMVAFMDVIEIHPPHMIFEKEIQSEGRRIENRMLRWLQMLNVGERVPGVVNTDAHYNLHGSGWLRNYVRSPTDEPSEIRTIDIVHAAERGHIVMTTGPFLEVTWHGADGQTGIPGDDVRAETGRGTLHIEVQCANWLDVDRVQIFVNGRPDAALDYTRETHPRLFGDEVVKFDQRVELTLARDSHVIVATIGTNMNLGPVFTGTLGRTRPVAVSNPIFVDVDGGGFAANGDLLDLPLPGHDR